MSTSCKHIPMRRCIGCMESKDKTELVRFVIREGKITPDPDAILPGRGFYLDRSEDCLAKAMKRKALNRLVKREIQPEELEEIREALRKTE